MLRLQLLSRLEKMHMMQPIITLCINIRDANYTTKVNKDQELLKH